MLELLSLRKGSTLTKEMFLNHLYGGMDEPVELFNNGGSQAARILFEIELPGEYAVTRKEGEAHRP